MQRQRLGKTWPEKHHTIQYMDMTVCTFVLCEVCLRTHLSLVLPSCLFGAATAGHLNPRCSCSTPLCRYSDCRFFKIPPPAPVVVCVGGQHL